MSTILPMFAKFSFFIMQVGHWVLQEAYPLMWDFSCRSAEYRMILGKIGLVTPFPHFIITPSSHAALKLGSNNCLCHAFCKISPSTLEGLARRTLCEKVGETQAAPRHVYKGKQEQTGRGLTRPVRRRLYIRHIRPGNHRVYASRRDSSIGH